MPSQFEIQVAAWAKKIQGKVDSRVRQIQFTLFRGIILSTPVDTGRARGNWQTTVDYPTRLTIERLDPSGANAIADAKAFGGGAGKITYLSNNLPYIAVLEYGLYPNPPKSGRTIKGVSYGLNTINGFSRQAPAGMVRINMARISDIIRDAKNV